MSKHANELCILLVDDVYGGLTSRVFEVLLCYGRLSFPSLLHHTYLTSRQLKHSLTVLIQQHLALWFTSTEDDSTYYEANLESAYSLIQSGKLIKIAEDYFGEFAGRVISNFLLLGHTRVGDLAQAYGVVHANEPQDHLEITHPSNNRSQLNGLKTKHIGRGSKSRGPTLEYLHSVLYDLLQAGLISPVHESHFRSNADNRNEAEKELSLIPCFQGALKPDQKARYEQAVAKKLETWKDGAKLDSEDHFSYMKGKKRRFGELDDSGLSSDKKRSRLDTITHNVLNGSRRYSNQAEKLRSTSLDDNLVLRINHDKSSVILRNRRFVELVEECIGAGTSKVYAELLKQAESKVLRCNEHAGKSANVPEDEDIDTLPKISTNDIVEALKDTVDLDNSIGYAELSKINTAHFDHPKKRRKKTASDDDEVKVHGDASTGEEEDMNDIDNMSEVDEDSDFWNGDADNSNEIKIKKKSRTHESLGIGEDEHRSHKDKIRQHLLLLAEHPYHFLHRISRTPYRLEQWAVPFRAVAQKLLSLTLSRTISSRFGPGATRLTSILLEKGKLDEKTLTNIGLINQKVMRSILTAMHSAGHLELQEIPRDTNRAPSKTIYLWYFDQERCRQKLLEETYQTMARCLQRARVEREEVQVVIDKAARTDVVGKEEEYLGVEEREALAGWREKEERILGELGRLDDMVGILRDF